MVSRNLEKLLDGSSVVELESVCVCGMCGAVSGLGLGIREPPYFSWEPGQDPWAGRACVCVRLLSHRTYMFLCYPASEIQWGRWLRSVCALHLLHLQWHKGWIAIWSVETPDLQFPLTVATGIELQLKALNASYICASTTLSGGKKKPKKPKTHTQKRQENN